MDVVRSGSVIPFDFAGLQIRDLTSNSLPSASVAQIEAAPGAVYPKAKSTKEPLNKSVTLILNPTRRSCEGRNRGPQRFRFLPSQERQGEGADV